MNTYKVNTGLELSLEQELAELKTQLVEERDRSMGYTKEIEELKSEVDELEHAYNNMKQYADKLLDENVEVGERNEELKTNMALMTDENLRFRETNNLQRDQIAMFQRRFSQSKPKYPFKEGDLYYVFNQLDGTWIESVWDDESERIHDSPNIPSRPHRVYFTVDQKNVLDKFNPKDD